MPDTTGGARGPDGELAGRRIAVDGRYLLRPGTGIHEYLVAVLRLLCDAGASVTLLVPAPVAVPAGVEATVVVLRGRGRIRQTSVWWEQVIVPRRLRAGGADVYWAPANTGLPLRSCGRTRLVQTVHDLIPLRYLRRFLARQPLLMLTYLPGLAISMLRAHRIMAVSAATAADVRLLARRDSVTTLVPLKRMSILEPAVEPRDEREPVVVYNGGADVRKNVGLLIEGFALVCRDDPDVRLTVLGRHLEQIDQLVQALGIEERVQRLGYVSEEDKAAVLASAAVMAYPSDFEGFGLPIVEALVSGAAIVCGTGGAQRQTAGPAGFLVDPISPEAIADQIGAALRTIRDPGLRTEYRGRQREHLAELASPRHDEAIIAVFANV